MERFIKIMNFSIDKKRSNTDKAIISGVFSTSNEDRHGDIVKQGWELGNFKKNPVIINSHNYDDVAEVIGRAINIKVVDNKLQGDIEFAVKENPKAKVIYDLYANGFLNAFSVGFIPKLISDKGEMERSELLEISAVSVPANAMALAKKKGIKIEKLYEPTNSETIKNKKDDGADAEEGDDSSKIRGGENNETDNGDGGDAGSNKNDEEKDKGGEGEKSGGDKAGKGDDEAKKGKRKDSKREQGASKDKLWGKNGEEIRYQLKSPELFQDDSFRSFMLKEDKPRIKGVIAKMIGGTKTILQSLYFMDNWAEEEAKEWIKENKIKSLEYEAKKLIILSRIANQIKSLNEIKQLEQEKIAVKSNKLLMINKAIRGLLKLKK